jgi:hypothetical protein
MNACGYLCDIKKMTALSSDDVTIFWSHLERALKNNDSISTDIKEIDLIRFKLSHLYKKLLLCRHFGLFMKINIQLLS